MLPYVNDVEEIREGCVVVGPIACFMASVLVKPNEILELEPMKHSKMGVVQRSKLKSGNCL